MSRVETGPGWSMHLGRWQTALAHVTECDALITDPPYSERTHAAYDASGGAQYMGARIAAEPTRRALDYDALSSDGLAEIVQHWSPRAKGWTCWLTSHDLVPDYHAALEATGRYTFAPLPCVISGMTCRLLGDGPSGESVSLVTHGADGAGPVTTYRPGQLVRIRARLRADRAGYVDHVTRTQVVLRTGERFSLKTGRLLGVGVSTTRIEPWDTRKGAEGAAA